MHSEKESFKRGAYHKTYSKFSVVHGKDVDSAGEESVDHIGSDEIFSPQIHVKTLNSVYIGEQLYECARSHEAYPNLHLPQISHAQKKHFKCENCNKTFPERSDLILHQKACIVEKCNTALSHSKNLIQCSTIYTGEQSSQCQAGSKSYSQQACLNARMKNYTGETFECELCHKTFAYNGNLKRHEKSHAADKPFKCELCHKTFTQKSSLIDHKRIHTGEKPYKCDVCSKAFSVKSALNQHKRIHTGEKPFECELCHKTFTQIGHLNSHRYNHSGEKPFECDICSKTFYRKENLNQHRFLHSGESFFECDVCHKVLSSKGYWSKHRKLFHGIGKQLEPND